MKKTIISLLVTLSVMAFCSCSKNKDITLNGKTRTFEPYGWANDDVKANDSLIYEVNVPDVIISVIFCETVLVPICITGWDIKEPVRVKTQYEQK